MPVKRCSLLLLLPVLLCLLLAGCFDTQELITLIQINADGSADVTLIAIGLSYEKDKQPMGHAQLLTKVDQTCVEMKQDDTPEKNLVSCGRGLPDDVFGPRLSAPPASADQVDGHYTLHYAKAQRALAEMALNDQNHKPVQLQYSQADGELSLKVYIESSAGKQGGTIIVRAPWPIVASNADLLIRRNNLALWNAQRSVQGKGLMLELCAKAPLPLQPPSTK
ncbi:MAG: hypothetical protein P9M14_18375 [Candidatus Alcyoniella australis]|nr:hypothetical protein [Candidatus Alcyoniella australis]